jgi:hypothetical protein
MDRHVQDAPAALDNTEGFPGLLARGFDGVRDTIRGNAYPFATYLEHSCFPGMDLMPDLRKAS